jgi:hypothetical protein
VGGWLILVGTAGGLGAAFFIAAEVTAPPKTDAINGTAKLPIVIKVAEHYTLLHKNCQVKNKKTTPQ